LSSEAAPAMLSRSSEAHDTLVDPIYQASRHAPYLKAMVAGFALLSSENPTAIEGTRAGPTSIALRLDPSAPQPCEQVLEHKDLY
jgi:hypothetical protein